MEDVVAAEKVIEEDVGWVFSENVEEDEEGFGEEGEYKNSMNVEFDGK